MASYPIVTYSNVKHKIATGVSNGAITYGDEIITPLFNCGEGNSNTVYKASYVAPFNQITGTFTSNRALTRFEIRVNPIESTNYGPGVGNQVFYILNIGASVATNFSFNITSSTFTGSQSNTYRICLLAQSELDYSWDFTQLFMTIGTSNTYERFKPTGTDGIETHYAG